VAVSAQAARESWRLWEIKVALGDALNVEDVEQTILGDEQIHSNTRISVNTEDGWGRKIIWKPVRDLIDSCGRLKLGCKGHALSPQL